MIKSPRRPSKPKSKKTTAYALSTKSQARVHVKNKLHSTSFVTLYDSGGGFQPGLNAVVSATGTQDDPPTADTFEWSGTVVQGQSSPKELLIKLKCTKGRSAAATGVQNLLGDPPSAGIVTITLSGGNPPPPDPIPVAYVDDGT